MSDGGKGSAPRPIEVPRDQFESNWEKTFGKKREWVGLTEEDVEKSAEQAGMFVDKYGLARDAENGLEDGVDIFSFAAYIEAKLKEKNS